MTTQLAADTDLLSKQGDNNQSQELQEQDGSGQTPARTVNFSAFQYNNHISPIHTSITPILVTHRASPLIEELRVDTSLWPSNHDAHPTPSSLGHRSRLSREMEIKNTLPIRSSSIRSFGASNLTGGSRSPASAMSSPGLGPFPDMTPLPSPISRSPVPWSRMRTSMEESRPDPSSVEFSKLSEMLPPKKRAAFGEKASIANESNLSTAAAYNRHRSFSEYVAAAGQTTRNRNVAVSGSQSLTPTEVLAIQSMHREQYLAVQRGISPLPVQGPPTPPDSNQSAASETGSPPSYLGVKKPDAPIFEAPMLKTGERRQWIAVRLLGTGSFSKVLLATSDLSKTGVSEEDLDRKSLVAVKVCEHGPAGGVDEQRIEEGLKREIEILKAISHPSLIHLKAVTILKKRAYLILNYCLGGDMFELASGELNLLTPPLVRRIFAELVAAVSYLHEKLIVHRDIKLENVLMNVRLTSQLSTDTDWQSFPHPVVTLTDLGLGRFLPHPPASQLLTTQCGSEDYAAPELLMGQEYDGRATDAWALGVLLYATIEGRLPFDPVPGARRQSPTSHRIARCEWSWVKHADKDGDWDEEKGAELTGAKDCVESLLRRARTRVSLQQITQKEWVRDGIMVNGGLRYG